MARINTYPNDATPQGNDLILGSNSAGTDTKVFYLDSVAQWLNTSGSLGIIGQSNYIYKANSSTGSFSCPDNNSDALLFSEVTRLDFTAQSVSGSLPADYVASLINKRVIIGNVLAPEKFGIFELRSYEQLTGLDVYRATLSFVEGSGTLDALGTYGFSAYGLATEGGGAQQTYGIISENGSVFDIAVSNDGDLIVIPEGSTDPVITSPPVIVGTEKVWYTLGAIAGGVTGSPTPLRTWQWQRSPNGLTWTDIEGATAATYTIVLEDAGQRLRVQQIETNVLESVTSSSDPTGAIAASVFADTVYAEIAPVTWGQLTVQTWD